MKKRILIKLILGVCVWLLTTPILLACPVCERQQPKLLKGVVHGQPPDRTLDYVIVWVVVAITIYALYFSMRYLIKPGEKNQDHIKYMILNDE